jgi:two-component system OmpR family response regulator
MEPGSVRILLVEDRGDIAEMYRLRLDLDGFKVTIASTGQQALELASTGWPDVVLLDLRLPDIDGFAVMNRLHSEKESALMSVIVLTDEDDQEMISRAFELGALDFLRMSRVTPDAVSHRIKTWAHTPHNTSAA